LLANLICECGKKINKNEIGLNKKLLGRQTKYRLCLKCLAELLNTTEDDLNGKIEYFKEQGCALFL
jgi:hypothetical protein